jgi:hypothetical protein
MSERITPRHLWDRIDKLRNAGVLDEGEHDRWHDRISAGLVHEERLGAELDAIEFPPPRWSAFTDCELSALLAAFKAADRERSQDDVVEALLAEMDDECRRRFPPTPPSVG